MKIRLATLALILLSFAGTAFAQMTSVTWFSPDWEVKSLNPKEAKKIIDRFVSKNQLCVIEVHRPEGKGVHVIAYDETRSLKQEIVIKHAKLKVNFFRKDERDANWHPASPNEWDLFAINYARSAKEQLPPWVIRSFGGNYLDR